MANWSDPRTTAPERPAGIGARDVAHDAGLRSYMLSVYNYMASGVLLTGIVAMLFSMGGASSPAYQLFANGGILKWVVMLAPIGLVFWLSFGIQRMSETTAKAVYWVYAVLMGLSLSTIFLVYTNASIATTFFASAAAFGGLSLYAMLINMFMQSNTMDLVISGIGVLLFAGLTAYDTQKIKSMYYAVQGSDFVGRSVVMGALTLYLDFINLFLFLLRFMGDRR
jgi:FtsH-binding integral membrane protein